MTFADYFHAHLPQLAAAAREKFPPAALPAAIAQTRRTPKTWQDAPIRGVVAAWREHDRVLLQGEIGSGKSYVAIAAAATAGYQRVIVMCPPHLKRKWESELAATLGHTHGWRVVTETKAKLGPNRAVPNRVREVDNIAAGEYELAIIDESHQAKNGGSLIGQAAADLMAKCNKSLLLTGTPTAGKPQDLAAMLGADPDDLAYRYGVWQKRKQLPGVSPRFYADHLIGRTVFMRMDAAQLPMLTEHPTPVAMTPPQADAYRNLARTINSANARLQRQGEHRFAWAVRVPGQWLDHPWDWRPLGYDRFHVVTPPSLPDELLPKEQALLKIVRKELAEDRQCWVFVSQTTERPLAARLTRLLADEGWKSQMLPASVQAGDRTRWIGAHGPQIEVMVSHPKLVETGIELFGDGYNYCTLIWYDDCDQKTDVFRQASGRAYRIGQGRDCRIYRLFYADSQQERGAAHLTAKRTAAESLEAA